MVINTVPFLILFIGFLIHIITMDGYAYDTELNAIMMEPDKYLTNLVDLWYVSAMLIVGVCLVVYGIVVTVLTPKFIKGIWPVGFGVVLVVMGLFLLVGYNNTAYYPSNADLQSSLTIANSCSSEFTLRTMFYVSFLIPIVLGYICYTWRKIDSKQIDEKEIRHEESY